MLPAAAPRRRLAGERSPCCSGPLRALPAPLPAAGLRRLGVAPRRRRLAPARRAAAPAPRSPGGPSAALPSPPPARRPPPPAATAAAPPSRRAVAARSCASPGARLCALALAAALPLAPLCRAHPRPGATPRWSCCCSWGTSPSACSALYLETGPPPVAPAPFSRWGLFAAPALLIALTGALSLLVAEYPRLALREWRVVVVGPALFYLLARAALQGPRDALALAGAFLLGASGRRPAGPRARWRWGAGPRRRRRRGPRRGPLPQPEQPRPAARPGPPPGPRPRPWPRLGCPSAIGRLPRWGVRGVTPPLHPGPLLHLLPRRLARLRRGLRLRRRPARPAPLRPPAPAASCSGRPGRAARPCCSAPCALALRVERFRSLFAPEGTADAPPAPVAVRPADGASTTPCGAIGLDQFLYLYPRYMHPDAWREPNLSHPHNLLLDFWLRLGPARAGGARLDRLARALRRVRAGGRRTAPGACARRASAAAAGVGRRRGPDRRRRPRR